METRGQREKLTIQKMIALYQRKSPQSLAEPAHYQALYEYAMKRLDGENNNLHHHQPGDTVWQGAALFSQVVNGRLLACGIAQQ